jgi:hypothetical protein
MRMICKQFALANCFFCGDLATLDVNFATSAFFLATSDIIFATSLFFLATLDIILQLRLFLATSYTNFATSSDFKDTKKLTHLSQIS